VKAAKKRYYKRTPEFWKVLSKPPRKKTIQEEWEEAWSADMQKYYKTTIMVYSDVMNKVIEAQKEYLVDTCESKENLERLSANMGGPDEPV